MSIWTPEEARKFAINCIMGASSYEQSDAEEIVNSIAAMKRREAECVPNKLNPPLGKFDDRPMPDFMHKFIDRDTSDSEKQSYTDVDGCPTELAVLKRFWREHRPSKVGQAPPSQPSTGVPEGWQLVPIEPTDTMCLAAQEDRKKRIVQGIDGGFLVRDPYYWGYKAMLSKSPKSEWIPMLKSPLSEWRDSAAKVMRLTYGLSAIDSLMAIDELKDMLFAAPRSP